MQFSYINIVFPKIEKIQLPGRKAQAMLAPEFRKELLERKLDFPEARKAGVLILLYPDKSGVTHFALILRRSYKGVHSNQVAFPGGKVEKEDKDIIHTALRETEEEIGVKQETINVLKSLTSLYIPPSNFMVYPSLAYVDKTPTFIKQEDEVEKIIEVPLDVFLNKTPIQTEIISTSYAQKKEVLCYKIEDYTIWGATAMMLSEFKVLMKNTIK